MSENYYQQAIRYHELLAGGMSPKDAFNQAFPNGVPTPPTPEEQAKQQQHAAVGQIGGLLAGALGTKYLVDLIKGGGAAKEAATTALAGGGSGAGAGGGAAALEGVGGLGTSAGTEAAGATAAQATPGLFSGLSSVGYGPLAAIAAGTYLGGKSAYDMLRGKTDNSIPGKIGRATLAVSTGGLSELGRKLFSHESTKDYQKKVYKDLINQGITGAQENYDLKKQQDSAPGAGTWQTGKYAGQEWSFDKANDLAKTDPTTFQNAYGVLKTFGNDWNTKYNQDQKNSILLQLANQNLFKSKKGTIDITDPNAALAIRDSVLGGQSKQTQPQTKAPVKPGATLLSSIGRLTK